MNILSQAEKEPRRTHGPGLLARLPATVALRFALCCSLLMPLPVLAQGKPDATAAKTEIVEKKGDLKELRGQIESLRKEIATSEGRRAGAADQLKGVEQEISATQRGLHGLSTRRASLEEQLRNLGRESRELEARLDQQQAQLEKLIYRQYLQSNPDSLRLLLNGENPNQMARDLHYLAAIGQARSELLREINATLQQKKALAETTRERSEELAAIEDKQKEQHGKLVAQREQRKLVLEKISAKISDQRREIGSLQRDEQQLSQVIGHLAKIIAAREAAERKEAAARTAAAERREAAARKEALASRAVPRDEKSESPPARKAAPEISNERTPQHVAAGSFAGLKGELRLPTRGVVANRFGAMRQEGSTWKGLFIRADTGSDVKAIATGRVVFADWMRGFGNILIVDHGSSFLSIYGNNDALLKQVGDDVRGGDRIASVGNSGGNPESGLYFELRHQGKPIDPLQWVSLK